MLRAREIRLRNGHAGSPSTRISWHYTQFEKVWQARRIAPIGHGLKSDSARLAHAEASSSGRVVSNRLALGARFGRAVCSLSRSARTPGLTRPQWLCVITELELHRAGPAKPGSAEASARWRRDALRGRATCTVPSRLTPPAGRQERGRRRGPARARRRAPRPGS